MLFNEQNFKHRLEYLFQEKYERFDYKGARTFRPRTFRPLKKYILLASADGIQPFATLQD